MSLGILNKAIHASATRRARNQAHSASGLFSFEPLLHVFEVPSMMALFADHHKSEYSLIAYRACYRYLVILCLIVLLLRLKGSYYVCSDTEPSGIWIELYY